MLIEAIDQALSDRGELIACLDSLSNKETFSKAESKWRDYTPNPKETSTAAIDSSWNFTPYQGFYLFAVEGVSTRFDGGFLTKPLFETGLGLLKVEEGFELIHDPRLELQSRGMEYEYELAKASIGKADRVLVDGSVLARF